MAQKRFTNYKDPVNSFPLGEMEVGIHKPGRYNGFRVMTVIAGMQFNLNHEDDPTNIQKTNETGDLIHFGAILTPNGTIVHEHEAITLMCDNNVGNPLTRIDIVVCEHVYTAVTGGTAASYLVIKGDPDGSVPDIPNPEKQVRIGVIEIKPGVTVIDPLGWYPDNAPIEGDRTLEQLLTDLDLPQATTTQFGVVEYATAAEAIARTATDRVLSPATLMSVVSTTTNPGVTEIATEAEAKNGTDQFRYITPELMKKYGRIRDSIYHTAGNITIPIDWNGKVVSLAGDSGALPQVTLTIPLGLPEGFTLKIICDTQTVKFVPVDGTVTIGVPIGKLPETNKLNTVLILDKAKSDPRYIVSGEELKPNTTTTSSGLVPMLAAIPYFPAENSLVEFDGTGLGIAGDVIGWAICNGNNGTRDLRSRFLVGHDHGNADHNTVGDIGGASTVTLNESQIPGHLHSTSSDIKYMGATVSPIGVQGGTTFYMESGHITTGTTGGGGAHENKPPFYTTLYIQRVN